MLSDLLHKASLFRYLYLIDLKFAEKTKLKKCPFCNGPLHQANYPRQPRGELCDLPDEFLIRFSFCCGHKDCRRRTMPPSCRFMGRKVYWWVAIVLVQTLQQKRPANERPPKAIAPSEISPKLNRPVNECVPKATDLSEISREPNRPVNESAHKAIGLPKISRQTLKRWSDYFRNVFPKSPLWQRLRGRVSPLVRNMEALSDLVNYFIDVFRSSEQGIIECLKFLALGENHF